MVETINISMFGIAVLLLLNLLFLFTIALRVHNLKGKVFVVEDTIVGQIRLLKERIELLEKALNLK